MYPTNLNTFLNPYPSDQRAGHAQLHRDINAVVIALQAKLGIDASADITSIDYLVKNALNPGHTHTKDAIGLSNVANYLQLVAANNLSDLVDVPTAVSNLGLTFAKSLSYASQAEAEGGTENTKIMTALRVKQEMAVFGTPLASDAEALAGVSTTKAITAKQAKDNYELTITAGNTYLSAQSGPTSVLQSQTTYTKTKEILVNRSGTYRVGFELYTNGVFYGKIYKNGIAIGIEHSLNTTTQAWTEDFTFVAGDLVQLYTHTDNSVHIFNVNYFRLTYDLAPLARYNGTVNL